MGREEDKTLRFVNPYNFVPLLGKCNRRIPESGNMESEEAGRLTGYLQCRMKLLSPLFIPNSSSDTVLLSENEKNENEKSGKKKSGKKKGYEFFSYEDLSERDTDKASDTWPQPPSEPVIPGSEIRGAVRSVFEAAFNGCMSSISGERMLSRRTNDPKLPGILFQTNGQWFIRSCEKAMLFVEREWIKGRTENMGVLVPEEQYDRMKEGQEIWIKLSQKAFRTRKGNKLISIGKVIEKYYIPECEDNAEWEVKKSNLKEEGFLQGWLHKGEPFGMKKHHESVFYESNPKGTEKRVPEEDIRLLKELLEEYKDSKKNKQKKAQEWYHDYKLSPDKLIPVYYSKTKDQHYYLSPACIGKEAFIKTINGLLKNNGDYRPCGFLSDGDQSDGDQSDGDQSDGNQSDGNQSEDNRSDGNRPDGFLSDGSRSEDDRSDCVQSDGSRPYLGRKLCSACRIFGMVGKEEKSGTYAYGSKIRITDAKLAEKIGNTEKLFSEPLCLPDLGEPRPGAAEFYTKSPYSVSEGTKENGDGKEGRYWTYDYKLKYESAGGKNKLTRQLLEENQPEIRGRKFYWHSDPNLKSYEKIAPGLMNQRIRPILAKDSETVFSFRVYFEHLSKQELGQLKWSLDFGDPSCAHKIGRAKPLGFGSVQIFVDSLQLRKIDAETGLWELQKWEEPDFSKFMPEPDINNKAAQTLKRMADWINRPKYVSYPLGEDMTGKKDSKNKSASHQWFQLNKGTSVTKPDFFKVLPEPEEEVKKDPDPEKILYKLVSK